MRDILFVGLIVLFFWSTWGLALLCERVREASR